MRTLVSFYKRLIQIILITEMFFFLFDFAKIANSLQRHGRRRRVREVGVDLSRAFIGAAQRSTIQIILKDIGGDANCPWIT